MCQFSPAKLRARREAAHLSQPAAAARSGVTERGWRHYELGERVPSVNTAARLAEALQIKITDLLDDRLHAA